MSPGAPLSYLSGMADQPDPPDQWRVYQGDDTPDPEPEDVAPPAPPYGAASSAATPAPVVARVGRHSGSAPRLALVGIAVAVLGVVGAVAASIFAAVDSGIDSIGGIDGIGGIDAKDPDDFAAVVEKLEEERGSTEVFWVGLYSNYIILDVPYTDDPTDTREVSYDWRGGDFDEFTKGTTTDPHRFDLSEIDPEIVDDLCDPVLELAEGATPDGCYVFISNPGPDGETWFRAGASDEFNRYYSIEFDQSGTEVARHIP